MIGTVFEDLGGTDTNLQVPVAILVVVCVTAIVFSILATRPTITSGTFTKEDIAKKKPIFCSLVTFIKWDFQIMIGQ